MNKSAVAMIALNAKPVTVEFNSSAGRYVYGSTFTVEVGDLVVVPPSVRSIDSYGVARVVALDDDFDVNLDSDYKFLVCKIDTDGEEANKKALDEATKAVHKHQNDTIRQKMLKESGFTSKKLKEIANAGS